MNFKDLHPGQIIKLINCPHCKNGDLMDIIHSESLLTLRPEKQWFSVTCKNCNKISMVDWVMNSDTPQISIKPTKMTIQSYIKHLNKVYKRVAECGCSWYPFKVEDFTKK